MSEDPRKVSKLVVDWLSEEGTFSAAGVESSKALRYLSYTKVTKFWGWIGMDKGESVRGCGGSDGSTNHFWGGS